jgi:hypothetical protein
MENNIALSGNGYIEVMGDKFDNAIALLNEAWIEWKEGPCTEDSDIELAKEDIITYVKLKLK